MCLQAGTGSVRISLLLTKPLAASAMPAGRRLQRQNLYFCTSKASTLKASTGVERADAREDARELASEFVLLYQ